ncbi:MAG: porin family protein [Elusimicrobia bacterium]|jgi:opacity protein-like surface antigen|nr:porin family protein [Elusimicrobiota bacterium]MBK7207351.1 porin family protein [Elusimicrobiota bacterium]MBK7546164.1 porin family protein [Elusimicrobiota bacterium]MBK7575511.1 porin family protein [Elusimicrobiota bacterium]MBK7689221.1 porin family protein [Elusimicrobiota bacterium]
MKWNSSKANGLLLAVTFFLSLPLVHSAEELGVGDTGFSIGPRASYFKAKDAEEGSYSAGVQARAHLTPVLGVEGSIDYRKDKYANDVSIKTYPVQASLLAYLVPHSPISPYLLGGTGWYFTRVSGGTAETQTDNRFGLHAGAGLEARLNEFLSVDGSYRYVWLEDIETKSASALDKTYNDQGSMITVAVNFLF